MTAIAPGRCWTLGAARVPPSGKPIYAYHLSGLFALICDRAARELWPAHDDWERILGVDLAEPMLDLAADMLKGIRLIFVIQV